LATQRGAISKGTTDYLQGCAQAEALFNPSGNGVLPGGGKEEPHSPRLDHPY
jgi:hypothetical protein